MAADVGVASVDCTGERCGGLEARRAVGVGCEPLQLRHRRHVRAIDAHAILAFALRPVERDVADANELAAIDTVLGERGDACREADGPAVLSLRRTEIAHELVADAPCRLFAVTG